MSDVIAGLRRDLEQRLQDIERELGALEPLAREREQIRAALERPPFARGARPATRGDLRAQAAHAGAARREPRGDREPGR